MLHARGVAFGMCFDALNLTKPALVADIHRAYIEAGAQIILTNTFGANHYKLAEHGLEARVADVNRAGVDLARRVALASFKDVLVAGDVGPLGVRLVPFGRVTKEQARAGASLIGGCCGTTPGHIAAIRAALDAGPPLVIVPVERDAVVAPVGGDIAPDQPSRLSQKLGEGKFIVAVEMDPPRGLSTHKLLAGATLLAEAGADVINVADSPMARMRMSPWAVCALIQEKVGVETTLHFPIRGRNLLRVQGDLLAAHALGIRNVFVVMGDPTAIGDYPEAMDNYDLVPTGLMKLIKAEFNAGVDHAGADIGQPTTFFVGGALNLTPKDAVHEIKVLRRKVQSGVDFFLTQPVYDAPAARAFLDQYVERYGPLAQPVLVGILPLYGERHARFLHNEVPGIDIAPEIFERLEAAGKDSPKEGVRIAVELVAQMRGCAGGVYLMPAFNRYDLAAEVVEACLEF